MRELRSRMPTRRGVKGLPLAAKVQALRADGMAPARIARALGLSEWVVAEILSGRGDDVSARRGKDDGDDK